MKRCSDAHDEIFHESFDCPFCKILEELSVKIDRLQEEVDRESMEKIE